MEVPAISIKDLFNRYIWLIILVLIGFYFAVLLHFFAPAISTPDAQGYYTQGRLIAAAGRTYLIPENNLQYIGPHWHSLDGQKYFAAFPPGFPYLIAVFFRLFGAASTFLINPILASISLLIFFLLCRNWLSTSGALLAVVFLALNPVYNEHALFSDSHTSSVFFFMTALLLLVKTINKDNSLSAFVAGFAIGMVPAIRYGEFVLWIVFGFYILWLFYSRRISLQSAAALIIGMVIPLAPLAMRNYFSFGRPWITGYSLAIKQPLFGFHYLADNYIPILIMLLASGMGLLLLLAVGGFIKLLQNTATRSVGIYFSASVIILTLTYMAYAAPLDGQTMRFLLPTFPIYTLAAVYFLTGLRGKYKPLFFAIVLFISIPWGLFGSYYSLPPLYQQNKALAKITNGVESNIETGSLIITYEGICQNLDIYNKWKLIDIAVINGAETANIKWPVKPLRNNKAKKVYRGLRGDDFKKRFLVDINHWSAPRIFVIAYKQELERFSKLMSNKFKLYAQPAAKVYLQPLTDLSGNKKKLYHERRRPTVGRNQALPRGPNWIFDFKLKKEPLLIVEAKIKKK